ncbi:uncharacterized protein MELLADRAFT_95657 [Melampsora larici-populina 98AG31]|uniref:Serine/threonine-protein phosphatase 2A activator n=1 Tax=Melampsora larici-populina (strain 98AG31 / pathotype 3-4-7) TaxID=747676 RepID=F4SA44_MELLP|nr:uncharacterized protein MELLADRAFT_95657 [Melampsora larici-populina 98AG31]EGF98486.1 hypothetical protein MELLADRAFT_95657 [Melampsora larici-populina 98AG31]
MEPSNEETQPDGRPTYQNAIPFIDPTKLSPSIPTKRITDHPDLTHLFESAGLNRLISVVVNMSEAVSKFGLIENEEKRTRLSDSISLWISTIPLDQDPQRFGNKAFKVWGRRLEEEAEALHAPIIDSDHQAILPELLHHFKTSFGSFIRLDYGTGHELSFIAYLSILHLTDILTKKDLTTTVLVIYQRYLDTCRKLQEVYRLEPAGSKGVYGLDDHFHLAYIFGSAQLMQQSKINPAQINDPKFLENLQPNSSLFFSAIQHIRKLKKGPFFEHSPILYNVGITVKHWTKVHHGMIKMWKGEVLSKVQVMQHFWFTDLGVLSWQIVKEEDECFKQIQ